MNVGSPPATVDTEPFPGTVTYTIPADSAPEFTVGTVGGNATWPVSCASASVDSAPPTCKVTALRRPGPSGRDEMDVTVQDTNSGLLRIANGTITNGTLNTPSFPAGTHLPVVVTATKAVPGTPTSFSFDVIDVVGNTRRCR